MVSIVLISLQCICFHAEALCGFFELTALVDNALLYSDGPVTLAVSSGPAGELVLHAIDRGPDTAGLASPHPGGGGADFQLLLLGLANP
jgi:hypothetical protein